MTRYVALLRSSSPLGGRCPACEAIMDESGCRLGANFVTRHLEQTKGIGRVAEVFCAGTPTVPTVACPACEAHG